MDFNTPQGVPVDCGDCGASFQIDPAGDIAKGTGCPGCGSKNFRQLRTQPSPTKGEMDGTFPNQVMNMPGAAGSDSPMDTGGNPLGEGAIVAALVSNLEAPGLGTDDIDQFGLPIRREPGTMAPNAIANDPNLVDQMGGYPLAEGTIVGDNGEPNPYADTHGYDGYTHSHVANYPGYHFNPKSGERCDCAYGAPKSNFRIAASQYVNQVRNQNPKHLRDENGQTFLQQLENTAQAYPDIEPMIPWMANKYKQGYFTHNTVDSYPNMYMGDSQPTPGGFNYESLAEHAPDLARWFNARQHPLRRGVNIQDLTPKEVADRGIAIRQDSEAKQKAQNWLGLYGQTGTPVHQFQDPQWKGWHVSKLNNARDAEAESAAMGHCIGQDDQPYKDSIEQNKINAYSLRDPNGYPHATWHFNPYEDGGAAHDSLAHVQGRSGSAGKYRDLISEFNNINGYDDEERGEDHLDEPRVHEVTLPGAENAGDYVSWHGANSDWGDVYEMANEYEPNLAEDADIGIGDPEWEEIRSDLHRQLSGLHDLPTSRPLNDRGQPTRNYGYDPRTDYYRSENPLVNSSERNRFYNSVLYNGPHHIRNWEDSIAPHPTDDHVDKQIWNEWQQTKQKSMSPQTGRPEIHPADPYTRNNDPYPGYTNEFITPWDKQNQPLFVDDTGMYNGGPQLQPWQYAKEHPIDPDDFEYRSKVGSYSDFPNPHLFPEDMYPDDQMSGVIMGPDGRAQFQAPHPGSDGGGSPSQIDVLDVTHLPPMPDMPFVNPDVPGELGPVHQGGHNQSRNITNSMNTHKTETLNMEPYPALFSDEHVSNLFGTIENGLAALAPVDQEIPGLDVLSDAAAVGKGASALMKGVGFAQNMFGGGAQSGGSMSPEISTPSMQQLGSTDIPMLLLSAGQCNCESSYCTHHNTNPGQGVMDSGTTSCPNSASPNYRMDHVGPVCEACANTPEASEYIHRTSRTADLETPGSVKSVDEQHDDPQEQDQKEFNDGDKSPSNLQNPNNEDSGASGEDGVRDATPGYGFGPNSPGINHMMGILPLLVHYLTNGLDGTDDPILQDLHQKLDSENPGYLNNDHPEAPKIVEMIVKQHGNKQSRLGSIPLAPYADPATSLGAQPMPGSDIKPVAGRPHRCPQCGGNVNMDGTCPQCGFPTAGTGIPNNQVTANNQGPVTPEQFEAASQWLQQNQKSGLIQQLYQNPENFGWLMDEIQNDPQPTAPLVDPGQSQPAPPPAMEQAPGSMPVMDPSQPGGGMGQPMQPMSAYEMDPAQYGEDEGGGWMPRPVINDPHNPNKTIPGMPDYVDGHGEINRSAFPHDGLGQSNPSIATTPGGMQELAENPLFPSRPGGGTMHGLGTGYNPVNYVENSGQFGQPHQGKTADANNMVPRCPECDCATTSIVDTVDGGDEKAGQCHNCGLIWDLPDETMHEKKPKAAMIALANPALMQQQDQQAIWSDSNGNPIQEGDQYSLYTAGVPVPDEVTVLSKRPGELQLQLAGTSADFRINPKDLQNGKYSFEPATNSAAFNTEVPKGDHPLDNANVIPEPTTDEITNTYPNGGVTSSDLCKCGSTDITSVLSSPTTEMHECYHCGHVWETLDESEYGQREGNVQRDWLINDSSDFNQEYEQARMMRDRSGASRNIHDIASNDERLSEIRERLNANPSVREAITAGKNFTQSEKRALIDEHGHARNFDQLDLNNTHYRVDEEYIARRRNNSFGDAPDEHLILGL